MIEDEENRSGGSGGDTGMSGGDAGNQVKSAKGTYQIGGNQVFLVSRKRDKNPDSTKKSDDPTTSRIVLLAAGSLEGGFVDDGRIDIRGCKAVRISSGPLAIPELSAKSSDKETNGVDIIVSGTQKVRLQRGLTSPDIQTIEMKPGGITINAGVTGSLSLQAGSSSIVIGPTGITINGVPTVQINPGGAPPPPPPPDAS